MMVFNVTLCDKEDGTQISELAISLSETDYKRIVKKISTANKSDKLFVKIVQQIAKALLSENLVAFLGGMAQAGFIKAKLIKMINQQLDVLELGDNIKPFIVVLDFTVEHINDKPSKAEITKQELE